MCARLAEDRFVGSGITRALGQQRLPVPVVILKPQTQHFLLNFTQAPHHTQSPEARKCHLNGKFVALCQWEKSYNLFEILFDFPENLERTVWKIFQTAWKSLRLVTFGRFRVTRRHDLTTQTTNTNKKSFRK